MTQPERRYDVRPWNRTSILGAFQSGSGPGMSTRLLMIHDNIKTISALLAPLWVIQWLPVESPHNGTGMWNFRVFLAVSLDKLRNIQPRCRWLETPCRPWMWRQCDVIVDNSQIAKFMGPTWVPPGSYRPQVDPMLAPWTLLSGKSPPLHAGRLQRCSLRTRRIW